MIPDLDSHAWPGAVVHMYAWASPACRSDGLSEAYLLSQGWEVDESTRTPWGSVLARRLDFGATLRLRRIAAGLTQRELAKVSGYCRRYICSVERGAQPGTKQARRDLLDACARAARAPGRQGDEPRRPVGEAVRNDRAATGHPDANERAA